MNEQSPSRIHYGVRDVAAAPAAPPVAVLVCHGMGQQVRYETISAVANAIRIEAEKAGGVAEPLDVRLFQQDHSICTRAEISWTDKAHVPHAAHVYEAYWAPLTEGRVTYWDTIKFLLLAAWNGLRYSTPFRKTTFKRWMFGQPQPLDIGASTWWSLVVVLAFLLAQVAIIAGVSLTVASRYKQFLSAPVPALHVAGLWHALALWLLPFFPGGVTLHGTSIASPAWWTAAAKLALWFAAIAEVVVARYFVIEFVGDVAAYISPYKDSKFDELRQKIQKVGLDVGTVIYGFGAALASVPRYQKVVVVGHSLGSVLAYDTLNALINLDNVSAPADRRDVIARTTALVTFGSPLDKTAFIFRMQTKDKQDWIREQLAASVQPLIVDYAAFRPPTFRWVNLWSPMDIISGSLDYYDAVPDADPRHVMNKRDPSARIPLVAHTQYWAGPLLRTTLYEAVTKEPADV